MTSEPGYIRGDGMGSGGGGDDGDILDDDECRHLV